MKSEIAAPAPAGLAGPPARPGSMQRARGAASAGVREVAGRTRLATLHQSGCLKLRFPRLPDGRAEAVVINSSGGLAGGDSLDLAFDAAPGTALTVTTQACERVYRSTGEPARLATRLSVAPGAAIHYLPQETILFDGGALARRLDVDCAASSRILLVESVVLGRLAMGETVRAGLLADRWRVRRDGRLVFAEDLRLAGAIGELVAAPAGLRGARAFATLLLQAPDGDVPLGAVRDLLGPSGGASLIDGLLVARLLAADGFALRRRLVPVIAALAKGPLPRLWSM